MMHNPREEINKVYIIGAQGVGKTNLSQSNTLTGIINKYLVINHSIVITLKDLSDEEDYKYTKLLLNEIEEVKAIIIVFSVVQRESFEYAKFLLEFILQTISNNYMHLIVCGNKSDLVSDGNLNVNYVRFSEVSEYLKSIPNSVYFEISCKDDMNVYLLKNYLEKLEWDGKEEEEDPENFSCESKERDHSCVIV